MLRSNYDDDSVPFFRDYNPTEDESSAITVPKTQEPLEDPENFRYTMFPIQYGDMFEMYKKSQSYYWVEDVLNELLAKDAAEWETLSEKERHFILRVLVFFVVSDGVVNENLGTYFDRISCREYQLWKNFQMMMEDIHSIVYSLLLDTYIKNEDQKKKLFNAVETMPTIKRKVAWIHKWMCKENDLHKLDDESWEALQLLKQSATITYQAALTLEGVRNVNSQEELDPRLKKLFEKLETPRPSLARIIFLNAIVEGVFFSGSFCAIFWMADQGKLHGLAKANELISRDEGTHTMFAIHAYKNYVVNKLSPEMAAQIMQEAVDIEADFIADALPEGMINMNATMMTEYIQFVANGLMREMGYDEIYKAENPFPFMNKQSISVRMCDFFKSVPVEYRHADSGMSAQDQELDFGDDLI